MSPNSKLLRYILGLAKKMPAFLVSAKRLAFVVVCFLSIASCVSLENKNKEILKDETLFGTSYTCIPGRTEKCPTIDFMPYLNFLIADFDPVTIKSETERLLVESFEFKSQIELNDKSIAILYIIKDFQRSGYDFTYGERFQENKLGSVWITITLGENGIFDPNVCLNISRIHEQAVRNQWRQTQFTELDIFDYDRSYSYKNDKGLGMHFTAGGLSPERFGLPPHQNLADQLFGCTDQLTVSN